MSQPHGIPTRYRNVQYRSRLEAKWAAFWDLMGWPFQYEPFDLQGWIPDFLLGRGKDSILVEVKPVIELPRDTVDKIDRVASGWRALILGCSIDFPDRPREDPFVPKIGWLRYPFLTPDHPEYSGPEWEGPYWDDALIGSWDGSTGITVRHGGWRNVIGPGSGKYYHQSEWVCESVRLAWNQAGNLVQWRGKQSVTF
jgi:hypothetical protein